MLFKQKFALLSNINHNTKFQDPIFNATVLPTSQVCMTTILVLLMKCCPGTYCSYQSINSSSKKALTVLRRPLAYTNGLLDLHIETFGRTPWPGDQPNTRLLPTQDNTTQKHVDTRPYPKQDSNLRSQCSSSRRQYLP
jgi:hypothetical protein